MVDSGYMYVYSHVPQLKIVKANDNHLWSLLTLESGNMWLAFDIIDIKNSVKIMR